MNSVGILGVGAYLPEQVVTNQDIVNKGIDTSDEWIRERTGIQERRMVEIDQATSDLAYEAAINALKNANISSQDIDLIVVATSTPDHLLFPSTAAILQNRLGIESPIAAFDISAACTGFNYAMTTAAQYVQTGMAKNVLVVAADVLSKFLNWEDRGTCILFGDGAGAVVLGEVEKGYGILASKLCANGKYADILKVQYGGSRQCMDQCENGEKPYIEMEGRAVFKVAVNTVVPAVESELKRANIDPKDVGLFVFHQANTRIIDAASQRLGLDKSQIVQTLHKYGNTSAASVPIALHDAIQDKRVNRGDIVVFVGFGAGFTWGINILKWA